MTSPRTRLCTLALSLLILFIQLASTAAGAAYQDPRFPSQLQSALSTSPCRLAGEREVPHGQQIEREDPCEFCICIDSNVFCWWGQQHCASNTSTTQENSTDSSMSSWSESETGENSTESSPSTPQPTTCIVMGRQYSLGAVLPRDTGTCLECVCGRAGRVTCSPKDCIRPSDDFHNSDPNNSLDMFDVDVF